MPEILAHKFTECNSFLEWNAQKAGSGKRPFIGSSLGRQGEDSGLLDRASNRPGTAKTGYCLLARFLTYGFDIVASKACLVCLSDESATLSRHSVCSSLL